MIRKMAIVFGLGGGWLDPKGGEVYLLAKFKTIGLIVPPTPFNYADSQGIYNFLETADWRGSVGDSFGADYEVNDFGQLPIDYCAGFQPSMYADDVRNGTITLPTNIKQAHCIRDPDWADTAGLGYAQWVAADPKKTRLLTTEHRGAHPDDTGYAQNLVFAEVKQLIGA
jgi:hypothetical protein